MTGTAVAAAAMAALTASNAPGVGLSPDQEGRAGADSAPRDNGPPGDDSYHTELPPLESPAPPRKPLPRAPKGEGDSGIPATVLAAYKKAVGSVADSAPGCGLRWELLAAIGKVESGQARGGAVDAGGTTLKPIVGPVLDGSRYARIKDTDGGKWDGDRKYDRAVGPMQFIPATWSRWGADGNGDGSRDPDNVFDAARAAGEYLCAHGRDLSAKDGLESAILGYNDSRAYLSTVLAWYDFYRKGTHEVPDGKGALPTSPGAGGKDGKDGKGANAGKGGKDGKGDKGKGGGKPGKRPGGGGHHGSPSPSPTHPSPSPSKPDTPSPSPTGAATLERVGAREAKATAGGEFADSFRIRAESKAGKPVKGVRVRFAVVGATGARFAGGATSATATTGADGTATAPKLSAGDEAGTFTVRATVPGSAVPAAEFSATVQAPQADALARTSDAPLKATTGGTFAEAVEVKATRGGRTVEGVPVTAQMITDDARPEENDKGPYFKDDKGAPVRTLQGLKTGKDGLLRLPEMYADENEGTFALRLTTADGTKLTVELTVTKA